MYSETHSSLQRYESFAEITREYSKTCYYYPISSTIIHDTIHDAGTMAYAVSTAVSDAVCSPHDREKPKKLLVICILIRTFARTFRKSKL